MRSLTDNQIIYEDNHLLVIDKPAGIATMGAESGDETMARMAAEYLKRKYNKPGNVYVGVVSRLDSRVSGVLVLARTSKAASRLSQQIRDREPKKRYVAWVQGQIQLDSKPNKWTRMTHWLAKNESKQRMEVVSKRANGAQEAILDYRCLGHCGQTSLIEVELITGRKHQIRVQLSALGHPVIGDQKYGSNQKFAGGIALHCCELIISHPTKKESMTFQASPKQHWTVVPQPLMELLA